MKTICLFIVLIAMVSCSDKSAENEKQSQKEINVTSITGEMGCENCGMNLKKYISTSHALKMNNGASHFYCSINCSTVALEDLKDGVNEVFAIDYNSTKYILAENGYYSIGTNQRGTMTKISKFAFENLEDAENFKITFDGQEIVDYKKAMEMSQEEIANRTK